MGRAKGDCEIIGCSKCKTPYRGKTRRKFHHLCIACSWKCGTYNVLGGKRG